MPAASKAAEPAVGMDFKQQLNDYRERVAPDWRYGGGVLVTNTSIPATIYTASELVGKK